eukprot:1797389-Prymnesium_polylepis.1
MVHGAWYTRASAIGIAAQIVLLRLTYALLTPYLRLTHASAGAASRTRQRRQRCQPRHDDSRHAAVAHASSEVLGDARKHGAI